MKSKPKIPVGRHRKTIRTLLKRSINTSGAGPQHATEFGNQNRSDRNEAVLYVHWPYCARRCTYCNFNKYISRSVDHRRMSDCLCKETETLLRLSGVTHIKSIFFGGGTPSLALPSTVAAVIETVKRLVNFDLDSEVTLEANPTKLETERLVEFKQAGVNRISVGLQALKDSDLKLLGRDHTVGDSMRCLEEAKALYPGRVSIDVIFGRPGQTVEDWDRELTQVLDICDNHISLYQLTLERGTQLFKWVQENKLFLPDPDNMAEMYKLAVHRLETAGLCRYEVSNFAREGSESQHNQSYWRGQQYIGVGPGAHGRFYPLNRHGEGTRRREARIQTLEPDNWMFEVEKYGHATRKVIQQSVQDQLEEMVSLGLRTADGISAEIWEDISGLSLRSVFAHSSMITTFIDNDLLTLDDSGMRATSDGLAVLDSIVPHLLTAMADRRNITNSD